MFSIDYVGLYISRDQICRKHTHKNHIIKFKATLHTQSLRSFLVLCSYCSEFISNFCTLAEPLQNLLRRGNRWIWEEEQWKGFIKLKELMSQAPVLGCPKFSKPFLLYSDGSDVGIGAV